MKFYYSGNDKIRKRMVENPLFAELCDFLLTNPDAILRNLKQAFPQKGFDRLLDGAVDQGLISREERRYRLAFPYYTEADLDAAKKEPLVQETLAIQAQVSQVENFVFLMQLLKQPDMEEFLGLADDFPLVESFAAGNQTLQVMSVLSQAERKLDLAGYFRREDREEVSEFRPLTELIGDVDEEYFFDQAELILQRVTKARTPRASIFLQALILGGILEELEDGRYQLAVLQVEEIAGGMELESGFLSGQALASLLLPQLGVGNVAILLKK